ncbi:MAG: VTT domain-containing protein, partial [bacterium]
AGGGGHAGVMSIEGHDKCARTGAPRGLRLALLLLVVALAIIVPFLIWGEGLTAAVQAFLQRAAERPALAALVLGGLLVVDIVAPIPSSLVGTACGVVLGFAAGTLVGFVGLSISCAIGYALGRFCRTPATRLAGEADMRLLEQVQARWGVWLLAALRPVPVLAEASVVFAGLTRLPLRQAAPVLLLANLGISAAYAAIGAWAAQTNAFLLAFLGAVLLPGIGMLLAHRNRIRCRF